MPDTRVRALRENATDAEGRLWLALRDRRLGGHKFRRQHRIGHYIVDFACTRAGLVVEADGGQHAAAGADRARNAFLESQGWQVIRFWNNEILTNMDGVVDVILAALISAPYPPMAAREGQQSPRPHRGRGLGEGA